MQILIAPTAGFEIPKPGTYRARIIEITEHPALNEDWGPQLLIKVQLDQLDSDDNPILLHYYCSQKLSRQSKLGKVVNTVIGKVPGDYSDSNRLNVADLINVPCGVLIEHVDGTMVPSVPLSRLGLLMRWLTGRGTACLGEGGLGFRSR